MSAAEYDDDFLDNLEMDFDDDDVNASDQVAIADDLFSEAPNAGPASHDLHGEFEGDLRSGLMARIVTRGAIKG